MSQHQGLDCTKQGTCVYMWCMCAHVCACVSFHIPATVMYKLDSDLHIKQDIVKPYRNKEGRCLDWEGIEEKTLGLLRS